MKNGKKKMRNQPVRIKKGSGLLPDTYYLSTAKSRLLKIAGLTFIGLAFIFYKSPYNKFVLIIGIILFFVSFIISKKKVESKRMFT